MPEFPDNIVQEVQQFLQANMDELEAVVTRPLRPIDAFRCAAVYSNEWNPVANSEEIGNQFGPTLNRYSFRIQNMVRHGEEDKGRALYAIDAKTIRTMLVRDQAFALLLRSLEESSFGARERVKRFGVLNQRFLNNELRGQFLFLATTEFWVETEIVPL